MTTETPTVPPTEPQRARRGTTKIAGSDLAFDPKQHQQSVEKAHWYWIGSLPGMPVERVEIGGQCFPKMEEHISRGAIGETIRSPVIGSVVKVTAEQMRRMRERLPRVVIRWRDEDRDEQADREGLSATGGTGKSVDAVVGDQKRRKGYLITIPTAAETASKRAAGRAANLYQAKAGDEPVSRYLFAQLCPNQEQPGRGDHYPEPLEATGLEWPGQLD